MDWNERRGEHRAQSTDGQIDWCILPKKNGKFFITARLSGGAKHRIACQEFDSAEDAREWINEYEQKRAAQNAKYRGEKPIRL